MLRRTMACRRAARLSLSWAWLATLVVACAINPRSVEELEVPPDGADASGHGGASSSPEAAAPTVDACATDCLRDVLTGAAISCKLCHGAPPSVALGGLDLASPNLALRLRDQPATHADVPPGSVCSPLDKLIDVARPEQSWLLKKVRGQQGSCGDPMPQATPPLTAEALACLEQYVDCVARNAALGAQRSLSSAGAAGSRPTPR